MNLKHVFSIWSQIDDTSAISSHDITVYPTLIEIKEPWKIIWNEGLRDSFYKLRDVRLPNETGGILLGYFDHKSKCLYLVDALSAPSDSLEEQSSFIRGVDGLDDAIVQCKRRTANIVNYIGEWHSHPNNVSSNPSDLDIKLHNDLSQQMISEGLPVLMVIVGENNISFSFSLNP